MAALGLDVGSTIPAATQLTDIGGGAVAGRLPGGRLFLQHGPINLVVQAQGNRAAVDKGYHRLAAAFPRWLSALVSELSRLKSPERSHLAVPAGRIARHMVCSVRACRADFVTPMAAVAGAVADEAIGILAGVPGLARAYVNNGGDIAIYLAPGESITVGVVPTLQVVHIGGSLTIHHHSEVRGIATSGWAGRSHSLGIADAVTVLAGSAAMADAAATLIANAVNVDDPAIVRRPATELEEESDLGVTPVTVQVPALGRTAIETALSAGERYARDLYDRKAIEGASLCVQGQWKVIGCCGLVNGAKTGIQHLGDTPR